MAHQVKTIATHIRCPEFGSPSQPGRRKQTSGLVSHLHVRSVLNVPRIHIRITRAAATIVTGKVKIAFKVIVCECLSACAGCVYDVRAWAQVCHTARAEVRGQFLKSELSFSGGWTRAVRLTGQVYLSVELSHSTISWYIFIYIFNIPSQLSEGTLKKQSMKEKTKNPDN